MESIELSSLCDHMLLTNKAKFLATYVFRSFTGFIGADVEEAVVKP